MTHDSDSRHCWPCLRLQPPHYYYELHWNTALLFPQIHQYRRQMSRYHRQYCFHSLAAGHCPVNHTKCIIVLLLYLDPHAFLLTRCLARKACWQVQLKHSPISQGVWCSELVWVNAFVWWNQWLWAVSSLKGLSSDRKKAGCCIWPHHHIFHQSLHKSRLPSQ